jgi:uncharacterized protein YqgC (DUF456 family)
MPDSGEPPNAVPGVEKNEQVVKTSKLVDAGLLVFLATSLSLGTSTLYVWGLSWTLQFPLQSYFQLKDYLDVTAYWLGPVLGLTLYFGYQHAPGFIGLWKVKKREPTEKWFRWFSRHYWPVLLVLSFLIYRSFSYDKHLAGSGLTVICCIWISKTSADALAGSLSDRIGGRRWLRYSILLGLPMGTFALALGIFWTPTFLSREQDSVAYVLNAKAEESAIQVRGKILFSLTQYLIVLRADNVFVVIPVDRVAWIETPKKVGRSKTTVKPRVTPASSPASSISPAPSLSATPTTAPTAKATATALALPSESASEKPLTPK